MIYPLIKRTFDFTFATLALAALTPLFVPIGIWIKLDSKGPVFYRGERVGFRSATFRLWKFRSMVTDADRIGGPSSGDDDPRITKAGRILRRYKLDELPQLMNVIKGEMSLVGPRPEVPEEVALYSEEEQALLSVRPGITDYASIKFSDEGKILTGSAEPHETYRELIRPGKMQLGLEYVGRASLWTDFKILWQTFTELVASRLQLRAYINSIKFLNRINFLKTRE